MLLLCKCRFRVRSGLRSYSSNKDAKPLNWFVPGAVERTVHRSDPQEITFNGDVPRDHLQVTYCRSSGPGGQFVNTKNTQAQVKFQFNDAAWIPAKMRQHVIAHHSSKLTKDGYFVIRSQKTRVAAQNLEDCVEKIKEFLELVSEELQELEPPPDSVLLKLKQRASKANEARLAMKKRLKEDRAARFDRN